MKTPNESNPNPKIQLSTRWTPDSILPVCGSYGQDLWDWLECTASCTIHAQCMEETSRRSILGRHQSCYWERIDILSDSIECNHSSGNTSSLLYSESCSDGNWRNHVPKSICVTSTTTEDFSKDNWMCDLDSDIAGSSKDTQNPIIKYGENRMWERGNRGTYQDWSRQQRYPTNPTKTKKQSSRTGRPVGGQESTEEIKEGTMVDHEDVKHSTRTERPACGLESTQSCVLMRTKIEEEDQTRTVRPVKVEEHDIDFRVSGLSHVVVKEAEHLRVQELVKKSKVIFIEQHFKPTCSRITSTTHSAKIRKRWSAN